MRRSKPKKDKKPREQPLEQGAHHPDEADAWQYAVILAYGLDTPEYFFKYKARKIIAALKARRPLAEIAKEFGIRQWRHQGPSDKQKNFASWKGVDISKAACKRDATLLIDAALDPLKCHAERVKDIDRARTPADLDAVGMDVRLIIGVLPEQHVEHLKEIGAAKRKELVEGIPE